MMNQKDEITRTVAIEHAGEKIQIEVHIHLSQEEIRNILVPAVVDAIGAQARREMGYSVTLSGSSVPFKRNGRVPPQATLDDD